MWSIYYQFPQLPIRASCGPSSNWPHCVAPNIRGKTARVLGTRACAFCLQKPRTHFIKQVPSKYLVAPVELPTDKDRSVEPHSNIWGTRPSRLLALRVGAEPPMVTNKREHRDPCLRWRSSLALAARMPHQIDQTHGPRSGDRSGFSLFFRGYPLPPAWATAALRGVLG